MRALGPATPESHVVWRQGTARSARCDAGRRGIQLPRFARIDLAASVRHRASQQQEFREKKMRAHCMPGKLQAVLITLLGGSLLLAAPALAQKKGGTLKLYHNDTPPSTSLHEESPR
jgi:hypothetical protein